MHSSREPSFFSQQVTGAKRFYLQKREPKNMLLQVICGGYEQTAADFKINRKTFPYYSIELVSKGRGELILADQRVLLSPGIVFCYGPNIPQKITCDPQFPMQKYFIDFTGHEAAGLLKQYVGPPGTALRVNRLDDLKRILDDLIGHGLSDSPLKNKICTTLLEYLMLRIAENITVEDAVPCQAFLNYQRCRNYIKEHFLELGSLEAIAQVCTVDGAYLCRLFKRFDTQSPYQYLLHLKMSYAAERLHNPGTFVKEIAYQLGFRDPAHFTRTFTKVFGVSPQAFKKLR